MYVYIYLLVLIQTWQAELSSAKEQGTNILEAEQVVNQLHSDLTQVIRIIWELQELLIG